MSSFVLSVSYPEFPDVLLRFSTVPRESQVLDRIPSNCDSETTYGQWKERECHQLIFRNSFATLRPLLTSPPTPPPSFTLSPLVFCPSLIPTLSALPQWNLCPASSHHFGLKVIACCEDDCMWRRVYVLLTQLLYFWCCELNPHSVQVVASSFWGQLEKR